MGAAGRTAGELPDNPGFDGAEKGLAPFRRGTCLGNMVQNPLDLGPRKIGGDRQPGLFAEAVLTALFGQGAADFIGTGALPDNGIVIGLAGFPVPDHRGFALVGNADGGDVFAVDPGFSHGPFDHPAAVVPDFQGIMLNPARLGKNLLVLHLVHA